MPRLKRFTLAILAIILLDTLVIWIVGGILIAPNPSSIGPIPHDLTGESVLIPSKSGSTLHGWYIPGPSAGGIVLLHGLHGTRESMTARARLLHGDGYSVLLFDFQANGESPGSHVTFGYLESRDAAAAVDYLHARLPGQKIGALGVSMGGAAATLAQPPLPVNALVLEEVYPDLEDAVKDRMSIYLGSAGPFISPLLWCQLHPRLGFSINDMRPIDHVSAMHMPKLFIAGATDNHTTIAESKALFAAAADPKSLWIVPGAGHINIYSFARDEYRQRVLAFLNQYLR
jgi:fermentation-respiration switch protein FrsA (DUF1100 family)